MSEAQCEECRTRPSTAHLLQGRAPCPMTAMLSDFGFLGCEMSIMQAAQQTVFANVLTPEIEHRKPSRKTYTAWVVFAFFGCPAVGVVASTCVPLCSAWIRTDLKGCGPGFWKPWRRLEAAGGWGSKLLREPHCEGGSWLSPLYPCPEVSGRHRCYV